MACKKRGRLGLDSVNNWIMMNFLDDGTYEVEYKHINLTILDGNVLNMYLIIMEVNYCDIYADYFTCHGYYIILFSSPTYTLQE